VAEADPDASGSASRFSSGQRIQANRLNAQGETLLSSSGILCAGTTDTAEDNGERLPAWTIGDQESAGLTLSDPDCRLSLQPGHRIQKYHSGAEVMFGIGMPELVVIFVIALLVFGPKELPKIGRTIGKAMAEFRRASDELREGIQREIDLAGREEPGGVSIPVEETRPAESAAAPATDGEWGQIPAEELVAAGAGSPPFETSEAASPAEPWKETAPPTPIVADTPARPAETRNG
jgi:TatA/E family protein of Tat protein translocase